MAKNTGRKERYRIKLRRTANPRWRMEPLYGTDPKKLRIQLEKEILKNGILTPGSYELAIKSPSGAMVTQFTGVLNRATEIFDLYFKRKK